MGTSFLCTVFVRQKTEILFGFWCVGAAMSTMWLVVKIAVLKMRMSLDQVTQCCEYAKHQFEGATKFTKNSWRNRCTHRVSPFGRGNIGKSTGKTLWCRYIYCIFANATELLTRAPHHTVQRSNIPFSWYLCFVVIGMQLFTHIEHMYVFFIYNSARNQSILRSL